MPGEGTRGYHSPNTYKRENFVQLRKKPDSLQNKPDLKNSNEAPKTTTIKQEKEDVPPNTTPHVDECEICGYTCDSEEKMQKHRTIHKSTFQCRLCDFSTSTAELLKLHVKSSRNHGEKNLSCTLCNFKTNNATVLKEHLARHPGQNPFACKQCEYMAKSQIDLRKHRSVHQKEEIMATTLKEFECHICGWAAPNERKFKKHIWQHGREKSYKCTKCDYASAYAPTLENHMLTHTQETPHKCEECGKAFKGLKHLRTHEKTHIVEKNYKCADCDYKTAKLDNLKSHMKRHSKSNPLKCPKCLFYTVDMAKFEAHIGTHTTTDGHKCPECDFMTSRYAFLTRHIKKEHLAKKKSRCVMCNATFNSREQLKAHARTHKEFKEFKCPKCPFLTTKYPELREHKMLHLMDESEPLTATISLPSGDGREDGVRRVTKAQPMIVSERKSDVYPGYEPNPTNKKHYRTIVKKLVLRPEAEDSSNEPPKSLGDTNVTTKNESHVKQEPKDVDMTDLTECSLTDIDVKIKDQDSVRTDSSLTTLPLDVKIKEEPQDPDEVQEPECAITYADIRIKTEVSQ